MSFISYSAIKQPLFAKNILLEARIKSAYDARTLAGLMPGQMSWKG